MAVDESGGAASSWVLIWLIWFNAVLTVWTSAAIPCWAWLRKVWIVAVIELRFCATFCAALSTAVWLEYELGLEDRACKELVKLLKMPSNEVEDPGVP